MEIDILGVNIDDVTLPEALSKIGSFLTDGGKHQVVTVNPEFIIRAQRDLEFRRILNRSDLAVPDGIGLLIAGEFLQSLRPRGEVVYDREGVNFALSWGPVAGSDLVEQLAKVSGRGGFSLYLVGGKTGVAAAAAKVLAERFPGVTIVGAEEGIPKRYSDSGLREEADRQVIGRINRLSPDVLLVAYGAPKQDKWIAKNLEKLDVKVAIGVGGTFDMLAGLTPRAPVWLRRFGLEWLWRFILEPRQRVRRVFNAVVIFPLFVFLSRFGGYKPPSADVSLDSTQISPHQGT